MMVKSVKVKSKTQPEAAPEKEEKKKIKEIPLLEKLYLTPADIVTITGCGKATVNEWFRIEGFPLIQVGQKRLVKKELFFDWFEKRFSATN